MPLAQNNLHAKEAHLGEACSEPASHVFESPEEVSTSRCWVDRFHLPLLFTHVRVSGLGADCSHVTRAAGWHNLAMRGHFYRSRMDFVHVAPVFINFVVAALYESQCEPPFV